MKHRLAVMGMAYVALVAAAWLLLDLAGPAGPVHADAGVLYVAPGEDCGGASPCFASIQAAVDAAQAGDEIRVAAGTYSGVSNVPALNTETFTATQMVAITKSLVVQGGYLTSDWSITDPAANATILDAAGQGRVIVVLGDVDVTLAGLRITGGDARHLGGIGGVWNPHMTYGGGLFAIISTGALTFRDGQAYTNTSGTDDDAGLGGAMYVDCPNVTIVNSIFRNNTGACTGGAAVLSANALVEGNTFTGNWGPGHCYDGGALYANTTGQFLVRNNTFTGNSAYGGGALGVRGDVTVSNNRFVGNSAIYGGAVVIGQHSQGSPLLVGNIITGNDGSYFGGAVAALFSSGARLVNNVIADNSGDAIASWGTPLELVHNTIARNNMHSAGTAILTKDYRGGVTLAMTNNMIISHTIGIEVTTGTTVTINGMLWHDTPVTVSVEAGAASFVQNERYGDPMFAADGYHVMPGSAALDWGVDTGLRGDLDGDARPFGIAADLGVDERATLQTTIEPTATTAISATAVGLTTTVLIPAGAVSETAQLYFRAFEPATEIQPGSLFFAGPGCELAAYVGEVPLLDLGLGVPISLAFGYSDEQIGVQEDSLLLAYWDGSAWLDAACGSYVRQTVSNSIEVPVCRLGQFALLGTREIVYLPVVRRVR